MDRRGFFKAAGAAVRFPEVDLSATGEPLARSRVDRAVLRVVQNR